MTRDPGTRPRAAAKAVRRRIHSPAVEPLEDRQLLTQFYAGPTPLRPVQTPGGTFELALTGPGLIKVKHVKGGSIGVILFGTTPGSSLNVSLLRQKLHQPAAAALTISSIKVESGQIGAIDATAATLDGPVTPLSGVSTLQFGTIGPDSQIDVSGSLSTLEAGAITLGPTGHIQIAGDLSQTLSVGAMTIDGGTFVIGHDLAATSSFGSLTLANNGGFVVGADLIAPFSVATDLTIASGAVLNIQRDVLSGATGGGIVVGGDLDLDGGTFLVGRNFEATVTSSTGTGAASSLSVNGDFVVGTGGQLSVGGDFDGLGIGGTFQGNGTSTPDLNVGLDLTNLVVNGGAPEQGGIEHASINVGKSLSGLTVAHGIFDSLITAGLTISNVSVGADGADAVVNSDIRAVVGINNVSLNGNVRSTFVANPTSPGYPTRIIAGEDAAGTFYPGGVVSGLEVTGDLIDSVVAASVQPYGGSGLLPPVLSYGQAAPAPSDSPGDLGNDTYDAPGGTTNGRPNWTELTYVNDVLVNKPGGPGSYDTTLDPTIDDFIFAGGSLQSVDLGGVISTNTTDAADFAGLFAANISGLVIDGENTN